MTDNVVENELENVSARTGWDGHSKSLQLTRFIDKMMLLHEFENFLASAELEESDGEDEDA